MHHCAHFVSFPVVVTYFEFWNTICQKNLVFRWQTCVTVVKLMNQTTAELMRHPFYSIRCPCAPVNVWTELPVWPTSTSQPAAGNTCVCVWTDLKVKSVRWTSTTVNRTPADWATVLTAPTPFPVSAHLEWQVRNSLQNCFLQTAQVPRAKGFGVFRFSSGFLVCRAAL